MKEDILYLVGTFVFGFPIFVVFQNTMLCNFIGTVWGMLGWTLALIAFNEKKTRREPLKNDKKVR